jgi:hypothetical protein
MFDVLTDSVEPGSILPIQECERLFGYKRGDDPIRYQFDLMRLSDWLGKELLKKGNPLTVTCDNNEIRVLTHTEASDYNQKHFLNSIRRMRKCHSRLMSVDTRDFDQDRVKGHDKAIVRQGRILQMIRKTTSITKAEAHKSERPVMFKKQ